MQIISMSSLLIPDVAALERECFVHPWRQEDIEESFNNPAYQFFVCRDDEKKTVGYISYYQIRDEAFVNNVCVTADCRRQGIGRKLVRRAQESAEQNGASFLSLEVRSKNEAAVSLYESEAFEVEGIRRRYYSEPEDDAFLMTHRFTPDFMDRLSQPGGPGITIIPGE